MSNRRFSNAPSLKEYTKGEYEVLSPALVTETVERDSKCIEPKLKPGERVNCVEVRILDDRIRGRLESGGWMSLRHTTNRNWIWARPAVVFHAQPWVGRVQINNTWYLAAVFPREAEPGGTQQFFDATIMESKRAESKGVIGRKIYELAESQVMKNDTFARLAYELLTYSSALERTQIKALEEIHPAFKGLTEITPAKGLTLHLVLEHFTFENGQQDFETLQKVVIDVLKMRRSIEKARASSDERSFLQDEDSLTSEMHEQSFCVCGM